jgi:hypothetical protein
MRIYRLLLFFPCLPLFGHAQHLAYNQYELLSRESLKAGPATIDNQYEDIKGDAFFSPQWLPATAITEKGTQYTGLNVKLDLYRNSFFANVHDTLYDLSNAHVARFILYPNPADTTLRFVFQKGFSVGTIRPENYVQVLAEGKMTFLKQPTLEIREVNDDSPLSKVKKFVRQDYYYLVSGGNGQGTTVRLNRKTLENEMVDKWTEVSRYAKEKNLSFTQEQGWISLVKFYNSL